jgi:flagellar hook-basal body complex protein FliE
MKSFSQMMKGGNVSPSDDIGGIDMSKVIENATKHLTEKIQSGEIDMEKFQEESTKNLQTLMKSMGANK